MSGGLAAGWPASKSLQAPLCSAARENGVDGGVENRCGDKSHDATLLKLEPFEWRQKRTWRDDA